MSYRFMRVIVFFDLPMKTPKDLKQYRYFRRFLIKEGFVMMQKSVYSKIALNDTAIKAVKKRIFDNKPKSGIVEILTITEKQFNSIEFIVGKKNEQIVDDDKGIVEL